jgi:hypothetical protein
VKETKKKTQKKKPAEPKKKKGKKEKKDKVVDEHNETIWEESFDNDLYLRLHKWDKNDKLYINIRRGAASNGVNIQSEAYWKFTKAVEKMYKKKKDLFPLKK